MSTFETSCLRAKIEPRKFKPLESIAKRAVLANLRNIDHGLVQLEDAEGIYRLGAHCELTVTARIYDPRFYVLAATQGGIGIAEAYRLGYWDADDLTKLFQIFVRRIGQESAFERRIASLLTFPSTVARIARRNTRANSRKNIEAHYDVGNDFFELFLDPSMTYSSGIFESPEVSMEEASRVKLHRLCELAGITAGQSVLEIGTGWGSFAIYAARTFGCRVTTVTISPSQHQEATRRVREAGLENQVQVLLRDYRDVQGTYDRIVSIEMIEAIGDAGLGEFFAKCDSLLNPEGRLAIQAITMPDQGYREYLRRTDVIRHFIFPGSCCPARTAILGAAAKSSKLKAVHLDEIGPSYAETLRRWRQQFVANIDAARNFGYSDEFLRLWHLYFCYCEAGFEERHVGNIHVVFDKPHCRAPFPRIQVSYKGLHEHLSQSREESGRKC
ncbi:MAG: cyclopropane-fatty-acyl-phospholipid synthase family protein [Armatimonadetes bacterium]|nr:cyclopropane-fatty-acyl-phospholipid synthase family protein [Armatimonadota bacterium]